MNNTLIQSRIYEIRGQRVMLDFDLAELYEVETRVLNQSMKRNLQRFPEDFMFRLSAGEWAFLQPRLLGLSLPNSSQTVMSSGKHRGKAYLPYAFTEHGVAMLCSVLRSEKAVQMNIAIVRAFIALRQMALDYSSLTAELEGLRTGLSARLEEHDTQLAAIYSAIEKLLTEKAGQEAWSRRQRIGFRPQD